MLIGTVFAEFTPPSAYTVLTTNTVFMSNKQIACATSNTSQRIQWSYQPTQEVNRTNVTTATWDSTTGISMVDIMTSQQGYYQCTIVYEGTSVIYTAAIFDPDITTGIHLQSQFLYMLLIAILINFVVITNATKSLYYTKALDPVGTQILCVSNNSQIPLNNIRIRGISQSYENPLLHNQLNKSQYTLTCDEGGVPSYSVSLLVQGNGSYFYAKGLFLERNTLFPRIMAGAIVSSTLKGRLF